MSGLVNVSHGLNEWRFACLGFVRIFVKSTIKYLRLLFFFFGWCVFSESSKHQKRCGKIDIRMNNCTLHRLFIFCKFYHVNILVTSSFVIIDVQYTGVNSQIYFSFSNIFTSRIAFAIFSVTRFLRMFEKNYIAPKARLRSELYDNFFMFLLFRPYILYFVRTNDMRLGGICGWILFITYHFFLSKLVMILFFNICICNECRKSIRDQTP